MGLPGLGAARRTDFARTMRGPLLARVEQSLKEERFPEDVYLARDGSDLYQKGQQPFDAALLDDGRRAHRQAAGRYRFAVGVMTVAASLGVLLPTLAATTMISPVLAGGAGVAAAALWGWSTFEGYRGKVNSAVLEDGYGVESRQTPYYASPASSQRSARETLVALTATGVLGEEMEPVSPKGLKPDPKVMRGLLPYRSDIEKLARQRRLLADLGGVSRYGKPVLQLVNSGLAARAVASGKSLYAVEKGQQMPLKEHKLKTASLSNIGHRLERTELSFKEQQYEYKLVEIERPETLSRLARSERVQGLPQKLDGVYRDEDKYSEVLERKLHEAHREIDEDILNMRRDDDQKRDYLRRTFVKDDTTFNDPLSLSLKDPSLKVATGIGVAVGVLMTAALPGFGLVGAAFGGLVGNSLGRFLRRKNTPPDLNVRSKPGSESAGAAIGPPVAQPEKDPNSPERLAETYARSVLGQQGIHRPSRKQLRSLMNHWYRMNDHRDLVG
jgi:hypothetical protein